MPAIPPRWQSSQRPLFVRTVWVNGIRHAILSPDDPLLQYVPLTASRPSTTSSSRSASSIINLRRYHRIEDCLVKLQLANKTTEGTGYPRAGGEDDVDEESVRTRDYIDEAVYRIRNNSNVDIDHVQNCFDDDSNSENDGLRLPRLGQFIRPLSFYEHQKSEDTSEDALLPELQDNPLSERVLQWLDLSGKTKRLHTPVTRPGPEETVPKRDARQLATPTPTPTPSPTEPRRPYSVRKKDIPIRSLSVDMSRNSRVASKWDVDSPKGRHVDAKHGRNDDDSETSASKAGPYSPIVQNYETTPKLRPVTAWPQTTSATNRPQLHIFMPPIDSDDAGRPHDEVSEYDSITSDVSK